MSLSSTVLYPPQAFEAPTSSNEKSPIGCEGLQEETDLKTGASLAWDPYDLNCGEQELQVDWGVKARRFSDHQQYTGPDFELSAGVGSEEPNHHASAQTQLNDRHREVPVNRTPRSSEESPDTPKLLEQVRDVISLSLPSIKRNREDHNQAFATTPLVVPPVHSNRQPLPAKLISSQWLTADSSHPEEFVPHLDDRLALGHPLGFPERIQTNSSSQLLPLHTLTKYEEVLDHFHSPPPHYGWQALNRNTVVANVYVWCAERAAPSFPSDPRFGHRTQIFVSLSTRQRRSRPRTVPHHQATCIPETSFPSQRVFPGANGQDPEA